MTKLSDILTKVLAAILAFFTCITIACSVVTFTSNSFYFSVPSLDGTHDFFVYASIILGGIFIAIGLTALFKFISKASDKSLKIVTFVLFALYAVGLITIIINFPTIPITDSFYVHDTAISMAKGNINQIDGTTTYFGKYSNNNMIVIILFFIYKISSYFGISDFLTVGRIFNIFCLMAAQVLFFFGIKKITGKLSTAVKFLAITLLYPTTLFMAPWVYTATFCMPFLGGILLCGGNILHSKSKKQIIINGIICGVLTVVGYFIRPIVAIISIAFFVCLLLWSIRDKKRLKKSALIVAVCGVFALGSFALCKALDSHYYTGSDKNFPLTHWVAMGLTQNGTYDRNLVAENEKLSTTQDIKENVNHHIEEEIKNYNVGTFIEHLYLKHGQIWGEGTQGFGLRLIGCENESSLATYFVGSKADILYIYCQMFWLAMHLLVLIFSLNFMFKSQNKNNLVFVMTMIGAYIFYGVWEVKPAYATPFISFIAIMAVLGAEYMEQKAFTFKKPAKIALRSSFSTLAIFSLVLMIIGSGYVTGIKNKASDPVLKVTSTHNNYFYDVAKSNSNITQYFYANKEFNSIKLRVSPDRQNLTGESNYTLALYNENDKLLGEKTFNSFINTDHYSFTLDLDKDYVPKSKEKFKLTITGKGNCDNVAIGYSEGTNIDTIQGNLYVNGKASQGDLWLTVAKDTESSLLTVPQYIIHCIVILLIEFAAYFFTFEFKRKRKIK